MESAVLAFGVINNSQNTYIDSVLQLVHLVL